MPINLILNENQNEEMAKSIVTFQKEFINTLDLDALFGHMPVDTFISGFKGNMSLLINDSDSNVIENHMIKTSHQLDVYGECKMIKTLPHIKLGTALTALEILDIFLVLKNSELSLKEFKKATHEFVTGLLQTANLPSLLFAETREMMNTLNDLSEPANRINCRISNQDLKIVLDKLNKHFFESDPVIFIETFGNKRSTISAINDIVSIKNKIFDLFDEEIARELIIDICVSSSCGPGTVTVANSCYFDSLGIKHNYEPLCSETVKNFHKATISSKTGKLTRLGQTFNCYKLNLYSTFKYFIDNYSDKDSYTFPISDSMMLSNISGFKLFSNANSNSLERIVRELKSTEQKVKLQGTGQCIYRTEIRCNFRDVDNVLSKMLKYTVVENFDYFNSENFFRIFQKNIDNFVDLITSGCSTIEGSNTSPESLLKAIITEYIFKVMYLNGSRSSSLLPKIYSNMICEKIIPSKQSLKALESVEPIVNTTFNRMDDTVKFTILSKHLKYSRAVSSERKFLLELVYKIYFNQHEITQDTFIRSILNAYIIEKTKDKTNTFKMLTVDNETVPDKKIKIISALKKILLQTDKTKLSRITKLLFNIFLDKFSITVEEAFCIFTDFMKVNSVGAIFRRCRGADLSLVSINFDENVVKSNKPKTVKVISEAKEALFKLETKSSVCDSTRDEMVRLVQALYLYKDSKTRLKTSLSDLSYYLFAARTEEWIKNRIANFTSKRLMLIYNEEFYHEFIYEVKNWSPEYISRYDVKNYLNQRTNLNEDEIKLYLDVFEEDKQKWLNSENFNKLQQASPYDIFYSAVQSASRYDKPAFRERIKNWSDSYIVKYPCLTNTLEMSDDVHRPEINDYPEIEFAFDNHEADRVDCNQSAQLINDDCDNLIEIVDDLLKSDVNNCSVPEFTIDTREVETVDEPVQLIEVEIVDVPLTPVLCIANQPEFTLNNPEPVDCEPSSPVVDAPVVLNNNPDVTVDDERKLFSKYRYCSFSPAIARSSMFSKNLRPDKNIWDQFINNLFESNHVSSVSNHLYKFNLLRNKGTGYLEYNHVMKFLTRNFGPQKNYPRFSAYSSRVKLDSTVRPILDDWKNYLDDLVKENVLVVDPYTFENARYYRLRN